MTAEHALGIHTQHGSLDLTPDTARARSVPVFFFFFLARLRLFLVRRYRFSRPSSRPFLSAAHSAGLPALTVTTITHFFISSLSFVPHPRADLWCHRQDKQLRVGTFLFIFPFYNHLYILIHVLEIATKWHTNHSHYQDPQDELFSSVWIKF